MSVRRYTARLATACVFLGALVALGGAPAYADEDRVRVRSAGSFTAGRSAEGVTVEVRKRTEGCVRVRTALGLSLPDVRAEQVAVQANVGGRWVPVGVSGETGLITTAPVAPAKDELCKGKGVAMRYRVAFAADAPGGRLVVTGEATTARGAVLGRAAASSRVVSGRIASSSPSPSPSASPSEEVAEEPSVEAAPTVALAAESADDLAQTGGESSGGSPIMYFGIAMVAAGALLIGLLIYRSRKDRKDRRRPADGFEIPPPRNPGGTTYRAGGGQGAAPIPPSLGDAPPSPPGLGAVPPPPPGQTYGTSRAGTPRVYGGTPAPRPSGGLYGARPADPSEATRPVDPGAATRPVPPGTSARAAVPPARVVPPASAPPAGPPPGLAGPTPGPSAAPTSVPPAEPGRGVVPGYPDGSPAVGEGDGPEYGRGLGG